jgi:molybdopterin synthase sulfur carrier subunit
MVQVRIPTPLRKYTGGAEAVQAEGTSVAGLVADLDKRHPGIRERICDETGAVRRFVNIFVNGEDIRFLQNIETAVKAGDEVSVVPAIAGGR